MKPYNQTHDSNGREYAKYDDLYPGAKVQVDGGFDCLEANSIHTVEYMKGKGLYIPCSHGLHFLAGQCNEMRGIVIGCYKVEG